MTFWLLNRAFRALLRDPPKIRSSARHIRSSCMCHRGDRCLHGAWAPGDHHHHHHHHHYHHHHHHNITHSSHSISAMGAWGCASCSVCPAQTAGRLSGSYTTAAIVIMQSSSASLQRRCNVVDVHCRAHEHSRRVMSHLDDIIAVRLLHGPSLALVLSHAITIV
ncbi:hypothetical protein COO60DRAFT_10216 [Scenedesmus sp. NREL 46B-D3]|nr:hypothetical protein COO60DRAFT_10216 [Scenedesmus sp. NREL 46B-D3]